LGATTFNPSQTFTYTQAVNSVNGNFNFVCGRIEATPGANTTVQPPYDVTCKRIAFQPYLSVWGSDAIAAQAPQNNDGTCSTNDDAGFLSWSNGAPDWTASGAQFAVQALGDIKEFASGRGDNSISPANPYALSFANTGAGVTISPSSSPAMFGGQFRGINGVSCDYTTGENFTATRTGNQTINGMALGAGAHYSMLVTNGNVTITAGANGGIVYTNNGAWNIGSMPTFKLVVVGGNIFIDKSVSTLSGVFVAEQSGGTGGTIYTCTNGSTPYQPWVSASGYYTACNTQLTIYGSFVAQQVRFLRTHGTTSQSSAAESWQSATSAEKFVYSPELWLANLKSTPSNTNSSITGLPPVL
jgi:hypothetical protein